MTLERKNDCIILTETPLKLNYLNFPKTRKNAQAFKYSKKGQSTIKFDISINKSLITTDMDFSCGFSYLKLLQITVNINVEILIHLLKMFCQHTEPGERAEVVHKSELLNNWQCFSMFIWQWHFYEKEYLVYIIKLIHLLFLKNLEISNKVANTQTIPSSFGGVGRPNTLFCGSQTRNN